MYLLNINLEDVWLDESGQFWISQGQSHFSDWDAPTGGISDIFLANRQANLDPGGFSFLLRAWSDLFGTQLNQLRTLSFIFWLGSLILSLYLSKKVLSSKFTRFLSGVTIFAIFFSTPVKWYAFEIRAYSMSLFGALLMALAFYLLITKETIPHVVLFIFASIFIVMSRYHGLIYNTAACLAIGIYLLKQKKFKTTAFVVTPVILLQVALFFSTVRYQNNGKPPDYVKELLLKGATQEKFYEILRVNWTNGYGSLIGAALLAFLAVVLLKRSKLFRSISISVQWLFVYLLFCQILSFAASVAGLIPWMLNTRWSLTDYSIVVVSLIVLLSVIEAGWNSKDVNTRALGFAWVRSISFVILFSMIMLFVAGRVQGDWVRTDGKSIMSALLNDACKTGTTYLDSSIYPDARYMTKYYIEERSPNAIQDRSFKLFPGVSFLEKSGQEIYQVGDCLIMNKNWDVRLDQQNLLTLSRNQFILVEDFSRDFGGLGWVLLKRY
jgi:hypothetical protein